MHLRSRTQAICLVILITATAVAASVLLAAAAIPIMNFEPGWRHWIFATVLPVILTPIFGMPLVHANFRLARMHAHLERMALTDSLTGLPNRRAFFRNMAEIFRAADCSGAPVALMMIDLDHFKAINDAYGHDVGDHVIGGVAESIRHSVSGGDGAVTGFAARIGGDEFAVVISAKDRDAVADLARHIGEEVHRVGHVRSGGRVTATVSIGVALRAPGQDIDAVMAAADAATYDAKRGGRDRSRFAAEGAEGEHEVRPSRLPVGEQAA